ncbi:MAG: hypothetical protein DI556_22010 [Rhodovulum sulfidophilum]|uniref:Phenol degradation protein meta n=1 Tax=Rhodovulum sulfidophilum TaxID=35806 RepID=A0A2W5Q381_RHOSU|nr:MAG: hypothetical protein DI556_22010 [Rhodovulum sulfidophilum]
MMNSRLAALTLAAALVGAVAETADATEGGLFYGPVGGSDIRAALVGQPGALYGFGIGVSSDSSKFARNVGEPNEVIEGWGLTSQFLGGGLAYVWPTQVLGGSVMSTVASLYGRTCVEMYDIKDCNRGMYETYTDLFYWSRHVGLAGATPGPEGSTPYPLQYGLTVALGMAVVFPTGKYDSDRLANIGGNTLIYVPNVAFTYQTGPWWLDGTELSGRIFYNIPTENDATKYQNGHVIAGDFALSQRYDRWQFGPLLTVAQQLTNDKIDGRVVGKGNKLEQRAAGFVVNYDIPDKGMAITAKYLHDFKNENRLYIDTFIVRVGFTF